MLDTQVTFDPAKEQFDPPAQPKCVTSLFIRKSFRNKL